MYAQNHPCTKGRERLSNYHRKNRNAEQKKKRQERNTQSQKNHGGIMSNEIIPYANKIVTMIEQAHQNALRSINAELIKLYWNVGEYLSEESSKSQWGDSFIDATANYIQENCPGIKGFNRRGLYRMRQFYETYRGNEFVSALLTQISWTNHLQILSGTKTIENSSIGVILCAGKEDEVVEFAMSRNLSPAMVAEYNLKLIDKKLLEQKLREFKTLLLDKTENENAGNRT
jgi:hypothetical protein